MRFLILAHIGDETALRVCAALQAQHGKEQVKIVSSEELVFATYWSHRLEDSQVVSKVRLSDGVLLESENIGVVFNRLLGFEMPHFASATEADREYATGEMTALALSWLASLPCPVVNTVTPIGLGAQARSHAEWLQLAGRAGLPVQGYHFTTDPRWYQEKTYAPYRWRPDSQSHQEGAFEKIVVPQGVRQPTVYLERLSQPQRTVLVAGARLVGGVTGIREEAMFRLAQMAHCDLLEITFAASVADGNWKVCRVSSFVHIHTADALAAVVQTLEDKQTARASEMAEIR